MQKKVPYRTCVVTREKLPKFEMIRIVKDKEGNVFVDTTSKQNGKGVYLKKDREVLLKAKKTKALERALETSINDEIYEQIEKLI